MNGNFGLTYPSESDYYNINVFNNNFSKLADGIDKVKSGGIKKEIVIASYNSTNPYKEVADFVCTRNNGAEVIANAIDACNSGGMVLFLDGDYYLKSMVVVNKAVTLCGFGAKTRIIQDNVFTGYAMLSLKERNITIKDLRFEDSQNSVSGIHIIEVMTNNVIIGNCDFIMNWTVRTDDVSVVYVESYKCRVLMVGCYISKHSDNGYVIYSRDSLLYGVVMGNYCESMDDDSEIVFKIYVKNVGSASRIRYAAQNTAFYSSGGVINV